MLTQNLKIFLVKTQIYKKKYENSSRENVPIVSFISQKNSSIYTFFLNTYVQNPISNLLLFLFDNV